MSDNLKLFSATFGDLVHLEVIPVNLPSVAVRIEIEDENGHINSIDISPRDLRRLVSHLYGLTDD